MIQYRGSSAVDLYRTVSRLLLLTVYGTEPIRQENLNLSFRLSAYIKRSAYRGAELILLRIGAGLSQLSTSIGSLELLKVGYADDPSYHNNISICQSPCWLSIRPSGYAYALIDAV